MHFCGNAVRYRCMVTKAAFEPNALAINLFDILPVADADNANGEAALGARKQQSVGKPRIYFYDLLHDDLLAKPDSHSRFPLIPE